MVFFHPKIQKEHLIIGVTGTAGGLGVTHLCIALANFMASKQRRKTACLELSNAPAFEQLRTGYPSHDALETLSAHRCFQIHDVDYYPNVQKEDIPVLVNSGYEILILDFGAVNAGCLDELCRCDRKFLLCSAAPWRQAELLSTLSQYPQIKQMESRFFLLNFAAKPDIAKFAKNFALPYGQLRTVPFLSNPFHIEKEQFSFFEKLI